MLTKEFMSSEEGAEEDFDGNTHRVDSKGWQSL